MIPPRWQLRITVALLALAVFLIARDALAATPQHRVEQAMTVIAGRPFELDCTYAARGGAPAIAFPSAPAVVYAKPWVCGQARSFARRPTVAAAKALLILTHESLHVRRWAGFANERLVECRALVEVGRFARLLGASSVQVAAVAEAARVAHFAMGWEACA